ncbi:hypothetical protein GCM10007147_31890 [Nocardiopsis kunsanensis]|uniref:Uncharacterized protein n=1 Tax=Nocardiopsis kunsanensis TaxID=141693 RepID=A0A919CJ11_9ACTN|nr:hypothetical protein GCM10007147_31890 [Nocardiopsis kunsanensis]
MGDRTDPARGTAELAFDGSDVTGVDGAVLRNGGGLICGSHDRSSIGPMKDHRGPGPGRGHPPEEVSGTPVNRSRTPRVVGHTGLCRAGGYRKHSERHVGGNESYD